MKVIFSKNKIDNDMIDIITISRTGTKTLWAVVHSDFLSGEGFCEFEDTGEQEVTII